MIRQWLSRIWPTNSAAFRDTDRLEEPVVYELRRFERMVREASDAALRNAPADMAPIRDRNLGTVFGPIHGVACYVFETDAGLALAKKRKQTDWLAEETKRELLARGYPAHVIEHFVVSFVTHEEIVRKAGGNYHHFFG